MTCASRTLSLLLLAGCFDDPSITVRVTREPTALVSLEVCGVTNMPCAKSQQVFGQGTTGTTKSVAIYIDNGDDAVKLKFHKVDGIEKTLCVDVSAGSSMQLHVRADDFDPPSCMPNACTASTCP